MPIPPETLGRLREIILSVQEKSGGPLPVAEIVALSNEESLRSGVTIDLSASETLGMPMVVLHPTVSAVDLLPGLTPRERDIAALIAQGLSNKEIAARLAITLGTVKDHVHNILEKTGLPSRSAVAAGFQKTAS